MQSGVENARPSFVLIHSPRVGSLTWRPVASALRAMGYAAAVPALQHRREGLWAGYARDVAASAAVPRGDVVLVAHSASGLLLEAAAETVGRDRVAAVVWADASLPRGGMRLIDTFTPDDAAALRAAVVGGHLGAWGAEFPEDLWRQLVPDARRRRRFRAEIRPTPFFLFEEPLPVAPSLDPGLCAYLQFSPVYARPRREAEERGWVSVLVPGLHLHMLADPQAVAEALIRLVERVASPG